MNKSILVAVTNDLNQDQRMHRICTTLGEAGFEVTLLGRKKSNSLPLLDHSFHQHRLNCIFSCGFLFYVEYNIRLLLYALNHKSDSIYAVDLDTLLGAGIASKLLRIKLIHDAHEYFIEVPELEGERLKKAIWNWIGRRFIPKANLCITVNSELAEILSKKYGNDFEVIRSVPLLLKNQKTTASSTDQPVILYQGVLNKGRGLEEAIQAVKAMEKNVLLKIAGEGDLSATLRVLVGQLQVEDRVQFLGWLSPEELRKETSKADVGLNLLSASSLNYKYSLANKFFDYMHSEVPSINMDFPVYRRICSEYEVGLCIDSLDSDTVRHAIHTLLADQEKRNRILRACQEAKLVFNWEREATRLIDMISKIF
ncbi:MAG: glycosyltransferase [Bacteroidota bacterium]